MADSVSGGSAFGRRTILIADDEPGMRCFIRDALAGNDYEFIEAVDGRSAQHIVERRRIDLIITDICMPDRDGLEAIQAIRQIQTQSKILAVSGAFDGLFLAAARAFGADAALAKPFRSSELIDCVSRLMCAA
jgi:two-component system, chemotaxis family, chemotaxis protein CheY